MNNKRNGLLRFFIYFDAKAEEYVGVCIDLSIIKTGSNPYIVEQDVTEAAMGYVEAVCRDKDLSEKLLNHKLPKEYMDIYTRMVRITTSKSQTKLQSSNRFQLNDFKTFFKTMPIGQCPAT